MCNLECPQKCWFLGKKHKHILSSSDHPVSDMQFGSIYGIFYLAFHLTFYLPSILTCFLAHALTFFLAFYPESIPTSFQAFILAFFLASILSFSLTFFLAFYLAFSLGLVEVRQCPVTSGACGWGSAVPIEIWHSRFKSGSARGEGRTRRRQQLW